MLSTFAIVHLISAALGGRTPLQVLGAPVDSINRLFTFGVKVFVKVDNASRRALEPKARAGVYIGYHDISDSHRVLVKNQTRFDIVDSVHVQVGTRARARDVCCVGG